MRDRVILLVDDDPALMYKYHIWMKDLSRAYSDAFHNSGDDHLYHVRVYAIADLDDALDKITGKPFPVKLDLVITDFDLLPGTGNDVAKRVRAKFPDVKIVGNTGGDPKRFDPNLVNVVVDKIRDRDTFYKTIKNHTTLVIDTGKDFFDDTKGR